MASTIKTSSGGTHDSSSVCFRGSLLRASVLAWSVVDLAAVVYASFSAHCWSLADAWAGTDLFSLNKNTEGLWSVCSSKWWPNKYEWNLHMAKTHKRAFFSIWEWLHLAADKFCDTSPIDYLASCAKEQPLSDRVKHCKQDEFLLWVKCTSTLDVSNRFLEWVNACCCSAVHSHISECFSNL